MSDENKPRIIQIQKELHDIDTRHKNLLHELYSLIGIKADYGTSNTRKNRLSKDEFRRLCSA